MQFSTGRRFLKHCVSGAGQPETVIFIHRIARIVWVVEMATTTNISESGLISSFLNLETRKNTTNRIRSYFIRMQETSDDVPLESRAVSLEGVARAGKVATNQKSSLPLVVSRHRK